MKKVIYTTAILLAAGSQVHGQGFLDKVKSKVTKAVESKIPAEAAATNPTDPKYTDPARFGTLIMTYSKKDMDAHMGGSTGGYNLWFGQVSVMNNQLNARINDYDKILGNYSNGQFAKMDGTAAVNSQNDIPNGSEAELKSKDFSQTDMMNAMLKKGPSLAGARVPGKGTLAYTFKGKPLGDYMMASLAHNPDSSAVAVVGMGYGAGGVKYVLTGSNGQKVDLPIKITGTPLISADGKMTAAMVQSLTGAGADVYLSNGGKVTIGNYEVNNGVWLHNSGAVYYVNNPVTKTMMKNGLVFFTSNTPIMAKTVFISQADNTACWVGDHGLYFSDGSIFENGECPHRVMINNKEVIVFLDIDIPTGKLYLCQHDL